jgi:1,4-dihydroxy-2-naphthoate polyprenyltransferase
VDETLSIRPGSARAWVLAARPATLTAAFVPVLVGTAVSHAMGRVRVGAAFAALFGALMIQVATNFANDVFDHEKGADTRDRLGPLRAAQAGLLSPAALRRGMIAAIALASLAGVYLTAVAGAPVVAIGVLSVLSGVAYTGGPYPLGYHGLGDAFVFVFFGLVAVVGTVFVETGGVPLVALLAAVPVGALATAVLVVNNVRDRATDVIAGKRTLAVRFGRRFAFAEYAVLVASAYAVPLVLAALARSPALLLPLLSIPYAARLTGEVRRLEGRELNGTLGGTARLLLLHGALFSAGLALSKEAGP